MPPEQIADSNEALHLICQKLQSANFDRTNSIDGYRVLKSICDITGVCQGQILTNLFAFSLLKCQESQYVDGDPWMFFSWFDFSTFVALYNNFTSYFGLIV